jgi:hypothetical protein
VAANRTECPHCAVVFVRNWARQVYCTHACAMADAESTARHSLVARGMPLRGLSPKDVPQSLVTAVRQFRRARRVIRRLSP